MKRIDIKELDVPNICFSLTKEDDTREELYKQQRIERGFDDSETWSLDGTFSKFMLPRLERYREITKDMFSEQDDFNIKIEELIESLKIHICEDTIHTNETREQIKKGLRHLPEIYLGLWW